MSKEFRQQQKHKHNKLKKNSWKKPEGKHSSIRLQKKHAPAMPKPGYRTPKEVRGFHPSGFEEVLVHNMDELEEIDSETQAARIASKVGGRKKEEIVEKADEEDIHVLNRGDL
ncbi:MAG: 50S ribosomal protein L32e [Candidatus Nanohalobium sp.]